MSNNIDLIPNREQIDAFLGQELTRKQFLIRIGVMVAAVFGVSALLRNLQSFGGASSALPKNNNSDRTSTYGGKR